MNDRTDDVTQLAATAATTARSTTTTATATASTPVRRCGLLALIAAQLALQIAVWVSLARRDARDINGPKWFWFAASFVDVVGPIAYLLGGRKITR